MISEGWIFLFMVGTFVASAFALRLPIGICLVIASVVGLLAGGEGFALRHMVEGTFGYLNTILVIGCAMMFMKAIQASGLLDTVARWLIDTFYRSRALLLVGLTFLTMFPGMITGSSTASVLTTGALVAPVLMHLGIPKQKTAAIIAMAAIYGMLAPPVNIPAMIIGGGIDMPYVGFAKPLLLATIPLAIAISLFLGLPHLRRLRSLDLVRERLPESYHRTYGLRLYLPFVVLVVLMAGPNLLPGKFPDLGMPLTFFIAAAAAVLSGKPVVPWAVARGAIRDALPVMGILMGVGMFIQVMTVTGVRGFVVVGCLGLPRALLYGAMAVSVPLFGAVSAFGSSSVLGVPFLLALLGTHNEIVAASGLTLLAGLGDLMPPTALAGIFAAQVVDERNYFVVLRHCVIPAILTAAWALVLIRWATPIARWLL
ncbi:MAG: TRAP transporter large permease subunit [Firmicutes bacterium]|jgi:TRAP-type C4-dicarboxylate transport system permease large subunit|nr:TRAP transporter large permease subunit [Bacillota bacterium]